MGFELTYGGVPFLLDADPELVRWVEETICPADYAEILPPPSPYAGRRLTGLAVPQWPPYPPIRLNELYYPMGASRWAVFRGLASGTLARNINGASGAHNKADLTIRTGGEGEADQTFSTPMKILSIKPLARAGADPDSTLEPLYLVTLVDERYWWQFVPATNFFYFNGFAAADNWNRFELWKDLFEFLKGYLTYGHSSTTTFGITLNGVNDIPEEYGGPEPDSHFFLDAESLGAVLDAAAFNVGRVFVREAQDGFTYSLLTPFDAKGRIEANRPAGGRRLAGGDINRDRPWAAPGVSDPPVYGVLPFGKHRPDSVMVTFPKYRNRADAPSYFLDTRTEAEDDGNDPRALENSGWFHDTYGGTYYPGASSLILLKLKSGDQLFDLDADVDGGSFPCYTVHDTAKATWAAPNANPDLNLADNHAQLADLARLITLDTLRWASLDTLDEVYPGVRAWTPDGAYDLLYSYRAGHAATRVIPRPRNFHVVEMSHGFRPTITLPYFIRNDDGHLILRTVVDTDNDDERFHFVGQIAATNGFAFNDTVAGTPWLTLEGVANQSFTLKEPDGKTSSFTVRGGIIVSASVHQGSADPAGFTGTFQSGDTPAKTVTVTGGRIMTVV